MALTTFNILSFLQLPGLGRISAFRLAEYALDNNISIDTTQEYLDFYNMCKENKVARALKDCSLNDIIDAKKIAQEIIDNSTTLGIKITSYYEDNFPINLKNFVNKGKQACPIILYYKGDINKLNNHKAVTIIGTREILPDGQVSGEYIAKKFADCHFNIVSGLALGCDSTAHLGALKSDNGFTTAILAHGLDTVYPKENTSLVDKILKKGGVLLSEYPVGTSVRGNQLVERDRLQAGLGDATIVIHTGINGGTMHAVGTTIENNKPLFTIAYKSLHMNNHEKVQGNLLLQNEKGAIPLTSSNLMANIEMLKANRIKDSLTNKQISLFDQPKKKD
ncbi:hypothetical protein AS361_17500 [Myroides marinus]|uniref:DNA-processing protein DprA n=1 Tax=Myroides marinus TaxID=703342 RepID=UPI000741F2EA|nr:DNA-processing protein DprA [Myroides marinus]KUF41651.1 hypothetical protein AS361_17500 [Myroides marinus]